METGAKAGVAAVGAPKHSAAFGAPKQVGASLLDKPDDWVRKLSDDRQLRKRPPQEPTQQPTQDGTSTSTGEGGATDVRAMEPDAKEGVGRQLAAVGAPNHSEAVGAPKEVGTSLLDKPNECIRTLGDDRELRNRPPQEPTQQPTHSGWHQHING